MVVFTTASSSTTMMKVWLSSGALLVGGSGHAATQKATL
jgi:hypothetical protein